MPSLSPGPEPTSSFAQVLPGAPTEWLQSLTTLTFRWKRYVVYISGKQLNILRSPTELVQAISFDEELVAVKAEGDESAKIAVASAAKVWILESQTDNWNNVTWKKVLLLKREDAGDKARSLSWGNDGELLVGGTHLVSLFSVLPSSRNGTPVRSPVDRDYIEERHVLWSKDVPSPTQAAIFSPSASLIASFGPRDRLVKIWRRLSFEEGLFDYAYLPHPGPVTHVEWRQPDPPKLEEDAEESDDARAKAYGLRNDDDQELLYTFCADGVLRVWKTAGQHELDVLALHTSIDLVGAIPHSPSLGSKGAAPSKPPRYAFILPSGALAGAIGAAISKQSIGKMTHSVEHLKEISSKQPDGVVTLDGLGRMSAWGLQTIAHRRRPSTPSGNSKQAYHIAHAEDLDLKLPVGTNVRFEHWFNGDQLNLAVHTFDGTVSWWKGGVEQFFSPATKGSDRIVRVANWSGSRGELTGLRSSFASQSLLAWNSEGNVSSIDAPTGQCLEITSQYCGYDGRDTDGILDACVLRDQAGILCVDDNAIFVIEKSGKLSSKSSHHFSDAGHLRLQSVETDDSQHGQTFLLLDRIGRYNIVTVADGSNVNIAISEIRELPITTDQSTQWKGVHVASHPRKSHWLRIAGVDQNGVICRRDVPAHSLQDGNRNSKEASITFPSGFSKPSVFRATSNVAALVSSDGRELIIADLKEGYIEHQQELPEEALLLRLNGNHGTTTGHQGDATSTLAIVYSDSVDILSQARYEPKHSAEHHTWHHLKRISVFGVGPPITSVAWLPNSGLAIAAGNAIFRSDGVVEGDDVAFELRDRIDMSASTEMQSNSLMQALRQPLVSWHPHFLHQLGLRGRLHAVAGILRRLERTLRFYTEGDELHPMLDASPDDISASEDHSANALLDGDTIISLRQQLEDINLPKTSDSEQERLKLVLGAIAYIQEHKGSLDENALRYLFSWKLHVLELERDRPADNGKASTNGDEGPRPVVPAMSWREITFAYHSETQQPILEALHAYYGGKLDWTTVRSLGIPAWLHAVRAAQSEGSDLASLEQIFDTLAQTAFRSVYPPDPTRASLYFLAMKKKATLLALWRVAVGNKEQRSTTTFLKRDFTVEENRTAARKNAYALMGKRRFEYAAAFFLLANEPGSAIRILAGQCQDLPLAIAVARVYCDDGSPELLEFMEERVLPEARKAGDRWLLSWVHEIMGNTPLAAQALVVPIDQLKVDEAEQMPRHWQQDDPLTLRLYQHLRDKPAKPGQKKTSLGGEKHEYRAVLRSARILRKMGLWLLALELVSTWEFKAAPPALPVKTTNGETASNGVHEQPSTAPSMLDDFTAPPPPSQQAPKSMLDDFDAPAPAPASKSLLDDFDSPSLQPSAADKAKADREAKAAELMAKLKAKKEAAGQSPAGNGEGKKAPTQFKEPEANSILDSFGF